MPKSASAKERDVPNTATAKHRDCQGANPTVDVPNGSVAEERRASEREYQSYRFTSAFSIFTITTSRLCRDQ